MIAGEIMSTDGNPMFGARSPQEWKQQFEVQQRIKQQPQQRRNEPQL